eukprot:4284945-Pyramimonas_sp.AAC.1
MATTGVDDMSTTDGTRSNKDDGAAAVLHSARRPLAGRLGWQRQSPLPEGEEEEAEQEEAEAEEAGGVTCGHTA